MYGIHSDKMGFTDKDGTYRFLKVPAGVSLPERVTSFWANGSDHDRTNLLVKYFEGDKWTLGPDQPRDRDYWALVRTDQHFPECNEYGEVAP